MEPNPGVPEWYRGPEDPSGYRVAVCWDLRRMRGPSGARLTLRQMAEALGRELHRRIPESSAARWESGVKMPGADVYRAYITISGAARPFDVGGRDERAIPAGRLAEIDRRLREIERERGIKPSGDVADPISSTQAARLAGVSRQSVHNWVGEGSVRAVHQGTRLYVSQADVLARIENRQQNRS